MLETMKKRRTYYKLSKDLPLSDEELISLIKEVLYYTPDAYNIESQEVSLLIGDKHEMLWDDINKVFDGKIAPEKINDFKGAYGTILIFINEDKVNTVKDKFPLYKDAFDYYKHHASGMFQINLWNALREQGIGASIQHYNPVIDEIVREKYSYKDNQKLVVQMVFGGIIEEPEPKPKEDINKRIKVFN